jgi:PKD repeat protein
VTSWPAVVVPRRFTAWIVLLACVAAGLAGAGNAQAAITAHAEPAFTNTLTNTWHFTWTRVTGTDNQYFVCFTLRRNGIIIENSNGTNGPGSTNCTGNIAADGSIAVQPDVQPLTVGATYEYCATDWRWQAVAYTSLGSACQATTIDNTKPGITTFVNGTDTYTRSTQIFMHIDYSDAIAPPFPANFGCFALGGGCTVDPATQYISACSTPNFGFNSNNSFDCNATFASDTPDGILAFCAVAADGAIPDVPGNQNQARPASSANLSDQGCGSVILDRTAPAASITASATSVKVGDLVNFSAQSSDATSGPTNQYAWAWGDNTANGAGANTSHTYTQPGTYEVKLTTGDNAGNAAEAKKVITVNPPSTGGGTGGSGGTVVTQPPTEKAIENQVGGGGTQETALGGLEVLAPKRFKMRRNRRKLPLALTSTGPGKFNVALSLKRKVVARGAATVTRAGRFGFNLKLPAKMKPGRYKLKLTFKPSGSSTALTKTLRIRFVSASARASAAVPVKPRIRAR